MDKSKLNRENTRSLHSAFLAGSPLYERSTILEQVLACRSNMTTFECVKFYPEVDVFSDIQAEGNDKLHTSFDAVQMVFNFVTATKPFGGANFTVTNGYIVAEDVDGVQATRSARFMSDV